MSLLIGLQNKISRKRFRHWSLLNYLRWLFSYKTRVEADSETVQDTDFTRSVYKILSDYSLKDNMKLLITAESGLKTRTLGVEKYVTKAYDLSDSDIDPAQTTESSQPFLGGMIAPNEIQNFKSVTGVTKTLTHTDIVVSGTYTLIKVLNAENDSVNPENSGKTVVSFTEVTEGTYNSISWTGRLYAYGIYGGTISEANQALIEAELLSLVAEVESVVIGTQEWATSNCEMVATPMGNLIPEMQTANAVEKITNTDDREFNSDTGWWGKGGVTISGGVCTFLTAGDNVFLIKYSLVTIGKWYRVEYEIKRKDAGDLKMDGGLYKVPITSTVGVHTIYIKATGTSVAFVRYSGATDIDLDNISIKELGWADSQELYDGLIAQGYSEQDALKETAWWRYPNTDSALGAVYGKIYNKYAAKLLKADIDTYNSTNPDWGWHIPSRAELTTLAAVGGNACKVAGTDYWTTANGTNSNGFTALGSGYINSSGAYANNKDSLYLLCEDADFVREIKDGDDTFSEVAITVEGGSIRLIKD